MNKTAYLTVDDCLTKDFLEKVDYLSSKSIPAILFCIGQSMEKYPDEVVYAVKKGFVIGNHSYGHPRFSDISIDQGMKEISMTDAIIDRLYFKSGIRRPAKLFRFPWGDKGDENRAGDVSGNKRLELQEFLKKLGYKQPNFYDVRYKSFMDLLGDRDCYWTFDVAEWAIYDERHLYGIHCVEEIISRMNREGTEEDAGLGFSDSGEVILIHDHEATSGIFNTIIDELQKKEIFFKLPSFDTNT